MKKIIILLAVLGIFVLTGCAPQEQTTTPETNTTTTTKFSAESEGYQMDYNSSDEDYPVTCHDEKSRWIECDMIPTDVYTVLSTDINNQAGTEIVPTVQAPYYFNNVEVEYCVMNGGVKGGKYFVGETIDGVEFTALEGVCSQELVPSEMLPTNK